MLAMAVPGCATANPRSRPGRRFADSWEGAFALIAISACLCSFCDQTGWLDPMINGSLSICSIPVDALALLLRSAGTRRTYEPNVRNAASIQLGFADRGRRLKLRGLHPV
jgi:hypothetical protein